MTIAWLDDLTKELSLDDPGDEQMGLMSKAVTLGCKFYAGDGFEKHSASTICLPHHIAYSTMVFPHLAGEGC